MKNTGQNNYFFHLILFLITALLVGTPAYAQGDKIAEIDKIFSFATPETPGCAVGVSQNGNVIVNRTYGLANVERRVPLNQKSLFDIGSTQKQFTAASVLLLVEDGRLSLSDDIRKYLPELPDYGQKITVNHLLTHTSGIRDWTGLLPLAEDGTDVLKLILSQRGLNFAPGEEWSYSSSGFELAKEIVARVSGMSFSEFTRQRLFEPLGMKSSAYVPDILQAGAGAALGYQKQGAGWKPFMRLGNNRGGGAIVSTVGDLLIWNDALTSGRLGKFVTDKLHEQTKLSNGRKLNYARGLIVETNRGRRMVWHSGGAAGFSTLMSRFTDQELSVAVTCNFDPVSATALAAQVADLFLPPVNTGVGQSRTPVAAQGVDVSGRTGLFFDASSGEPLRLIADEGKLTIANGAPLVALSADRFVPTRATLFFRSQDEFELTFLSNDEFEIKSMEGQITRYRRSQSWTPSAADLQAVDGRYHSEELGTTFEILPGKKGIMMRFEQTPNKALELEPVAPDTYMRSLMIVRFRRDANGKITGFDYGNPVVRNIPFTRLGDRKESSARESAAGTPAGQPPRLEGLVGEYEIDPGRTITVTLENGQLLGQPTGSQKRTLVYVSGATFAVGQAGSPITVTFTLGMTGAQPGC